jgi:hypothetical protein
MIARTAPTHPAGTRGGLGLPAACMSGDTMCLRRDRLEKIDWKIPIKCLSTNFCLPTTTFLILESKNNSV